MRSTSSTWRSRARNGGVPLVVRKHGRWTWLALGWLLTGACNTILGFGDPTPAIAPSRDAAAPVPDAGGLEGADAAVPLADDASVDNSDAATVAPDAPVVAFDAPPAPIDAGGSVPDAFVNADGPAPDALADASGSAPDALNCGLGMKACGGGCVASDVTHGCDDAFRCTACAANETCVGLPSSCQCVAEPMATTCETVECGFTANNCGTLVDCGTSACHAPPPATCATATVRRTYVSPGMCSTNTCTYVPKDIACDTGEICEAGACKPCTTEPLTQSCGNCGMQTRTCNGGVLSAWSTCQAQGVCSFPSTQACGADGMQSCTASCQWDTCACVGASSQACACDGSEMQMRTCTNGTWSSWSSCSCMPEVVVPAGLAKPAANILLDSNRIYWNDADINGGIHSCVIGDCAATIKTIASGEYKYISPVFRGSDIYFGFWKTNGNGAISRCAKTGCISPTPISTTTGWIQRIAYDDTTVYSTVRRYDDTTWVDSAPIDGGMTTQFLSLPNSSYASGLLVYSDEVVFSTYIGGGILTCGKTIPCPGAGDLALGESGPLFMVGDDTNVYWIAGGAVKRCARSGCSETPTVIVSGQPHARQLAVDSTHVYFTSQYTIGPDGSVARCPLTGCGTTPEILVPNIRAPDGITVDDTYVYWSEWADDSHTTIKRLPKP